MKHQIVIVMAVIGLAACSPGERKASAEVTKPSAGEQASAGNTPRPVHEVPGDDLFHGYRCDFDCSRHQAGYEWASQHKIDNPKDCRGTSQSFIEGCLAFTGEEGPFGQREVFQDED
ncbi:MAG TPA: hypothetical protein VKB67_01170 [Rhizomicrobium sp.]|nr:hypothetical protein [Rhizomicrobium sp.]